MAESVPATTTVKRPYFLGANWKSNGTSYFIRDIINNLINDILFDPKLMGKLNHIYNDIESRSGYCTYKSSFVIGESFGQGWRSGWILRLVEIPTWRLHRRDRGRSLKRYGNWLYDNWTLWEKNSFLRDKRRSLGENKASHRVWPWHYILHRRKAWPARGRQDLVSPRWAA